jgi:hypothetical protein
VTAILPFTRGSLLGVKGLLLALCVARGCTFPCFRHGFGRTWVGYDAVRGCCPFARREVRLSPVYSAMRTVLRLPGSALGK